MKPSKRMLGWMLWSGLLMLPAGFAAGCAATAGNGDSGVQEGAAETKKGETSKEKKGDPRASKKPAPPEATGAAKPAPSTGAYTNADLERMFGPSEPSPAKAAESKDGAPLEQADPLKLMEEEQRQASDRQAQLAAAEKAVADAEANVRDLEKRLLEFRNPLLPRPKLSDEEIEAQKGMNNAERVKRTEEQLEQARTEVDRARAQLAKVRSGS